MLAFFILASVSNPKLAIVARFYYPYPEKRISYERLYTVDWDGSHRRLLSTKGQHCRQVMWVGRDRLVYEVADSITYTTELWTVRTNGGKPKLLAKNGSIDKEAAFRSCNDGVPVVTVNQSKVMTISADSGKLVPITLKQNSWFDPFDREDGVAYTVRSQDKANPGSFIVNSDCEASLITQKGRVVMSMPIYRGTYDPRTNRLWVQDYPTMHSKRLHRVRWDKGTIEMLFRAGYSLDWRPDRRQVAFTTQRDLSSYGPDKQVWTNELWVGMLETGDQRKLKLPMAWYDDVAVRPN